jgi:hypothetical protein
MATKVDRNIVYLNKDFPALRNQLVNYTKTYFPNTYNDFSEASPGMMFIELSSYVGDVLSFYLENQVQETYIQYANETNNIFELAYMYGYKPKVSSAAIAPITLTQQVPVTQSVNGPIPDFRYAVTIPDNTKISSPDTSLQTFIIGDSVDFNFSSSTDPTSIRIASTTGGSPTPDYYFITKTRNASAGNIVTTTFTFGNPVEFATVNINAENILGILDITDSDGNTWNEVDYLGQDMIYEPIKNTNTNDPNNFEDSSDVPYLLKLKKVQRRFVTRFTDSGSLQIQFGSGTTSDNDELVTPNVDNVGLGLPYERDKTNTAYSPTNFIFTNTYGIAPSNTTLTVRYLQGGGIASNVVAGALSNLDKTNVKFNSLNLDASTANFIFSTITGVNSTAATGGSDGDSIEQVRKNAISNFPSQLRAVTPDDYLVRALSLPSQFGNIAKVLVTSPNANENNANLSLYLLAFDVDKKLKNPSTALKNNLRTYLNQFRSLGDNIILKDGFVINIGVEFEIVVLPNYNSNEVLTKAIQVVRDYFNIDNWEINQPINIQELENLLYGNNARGTTVIEGIQTVKRINITNKSGTNNNYSQFSYDIDGATFNKVIYPSIDPSIFEVKFPETDITGKAVNN